MDFSEKFRPKTPEQLVGELQQKIARSFETTEYRKILFIGPSGCGKTTLGMMYAQRFIGNEKLRNAVMMVNCGEQTGVDFIREHVIATLNYYPLPPVEKKIFFFDEIHMLSRPAQTSLLIPMESENLPKHTIIIGSTTDAAKLLPALKSRFKKYELRPPSRKGFRTRCLQILKKEKVSIEEINPNIIDELIDSCGGNLRTLDNLLEDYVSGVFEPVVILDKEDSLLHLLIKTKNPSLSQLYNALDKEVDMNSAVIGLCRYASRVLSNSRSNGMYLENSKRVVRILGQGLNKQVDERTAFQHLLLKFTEEK